MNKNLIVFDTDCLRCFLVVGEMSLLKKLFNKIIIPQQVYDELDRINTKKYKEIIDDLIEEEFVVIMGFDSDSPDYLNYRNLLKEKFVHVNERTGKKRVFTIGKGEATAVIIAVSVGGVIASNNTRDIIQLVERYNLEWVRTGDILNDAVDRELLSLDEASKLWVEMINRGRFLHPDDFKDFEPTMKHFKLNYIGE